jgi:hypothetical protein
MAISCSKDIRLGNRTVGHITIDPGELSADSNLRSPHLIVPGHVHFHNRPADEMLALVQVRGELRLANQFRIAHSLDIDLWQGLQCRSLPEGGVDQRVYLEFPLTATDVEMLERMRHKSTPGRFDLGVRFSVQVAAITTIGEPTSGLPDPFGFQLGLHSQASIFWHASIDDALFEVDPTVWIRAVLPAFDRQGVRLVELTLPFAADDKHAMSLFNAAEAEFTLTNYGKAIANCRVIFSGWSSRLGATKQRHVSAIVAERAGWPAGDLRTKMVDDLWQALLTLTNDEHHTERPPSTGPIGEQDARFVLMATAVLSDYVGRLLAVPSSPILDIANATDD